MKGRYAAAFSAALREALACLEPRLRSVLRSTYVDGVSADKLAKLYGVHRVTVARWLGDARLAVAEDTRRRMAVALAVPAEESESILRLVRSRLDLSLGALDAGAFDANA
jgi:RNA polymerase sigma-70 factor (ECF subfamily)